MTEPTPRPDRRENPPTKQESATLWAEMLRQSLHNFLELSGITKTAFAAEYGCAAPYLSRMLSGLKAVNEPAFFRVVIAHGYTVTIHVNKRTVDLTKKALE